jgi:hypothetical protein
MAEKERVDTFFDKLYSDAKHIKAQKSMMQLQAEQSEHNILTTEDGAPLFEEGEEEITSPEENRKRFRRRELHRNIDEYKEKIARKEEEKRLKLEEEQRL